MTFASRQEVLFLRRSLKRENLYDSVQVGLTCGIKDQTKDLYPMLVLEDKEHRIQGASIRLAM